MRKKYLSALLFGALLFASAGTFTSCKDYDDDINGLRTEITDLKSAIDELKTKIGDGKFVTNVAANGQGLTISWNDGSSTTIENVVNEATGETEAGDVITFDETTGEILINGEGSGYYAAKNPETGEVKVPYVNNDGALVLINEEGEEVVTNILTAPVTAVENADGSFTLTIRANGSTQQVIVPSAASAISEIEFLDSKYQTVQTTNDIKLVYWKAAATTKWKGPRGNIAQNTITYSTDLRDVDNNGSLDDALYTRIAPASIDASQIEFGLIDTQDNLASIELTAEKYDDVLTRAASNGLYTVTVVPGSFIGSEAAFTGQFTYGGAEKAMALKPTTANYKSLPNVEVNTANSTSTTLGSIYFNDNDTQANVGTDLLTPVANPSVRQIKVGETINVSVENEYRMYDMYLSASEEDVALFGLEFSEDGRSFKATKSPDNVTDATIDLIVHTLANAGGDGNIEETIIRVEINRTLGEATYEKQTQMPTKVNYEFLVSADKLKESLGDDLNAWYASVKTTSTSSTPVDVLEGIYTDEACETPADLSANQLLVNMVEKLNTPVTEANIATKLNGLEFQLNINKTAKPLKIGTTYYAKLSFVDKNSGKELNNVVVPFELTKPELSTILVKESGVFRDGDNLAYAYMYWGDATSKKSDGTIDLTQTADSRYYIDRAFTDLYDKLNAAHMTLGTGFKFELEKNTNVEGTDKKTGYFADPINQNSGRDYIQLIEDTDSDGKNDFAGYKKDLIVNFTGHYLDVNDDSYKYTDTYKFRIMSPILEGEAIAANNMVEVSATGRTKIYKEDIWAKTYNNDVKYDIFKNEDKNWYRDDIKSVTFSSGNVNVFEMTQATPTDPVVTNDKVTEDSYIEVEGVSENTAKLNVAIEDIWGYKLEDQVDIKTTLNLGE